MAIKFLKLKLLFGFLFLSGSLQSAEIALTDELKAEIIDKVIEQLENEYVLPDRGLVAASELRGRFETGYFDEISDPRIFGFRITHVLDAIDDWHMWVNYYPDPIRVDYVARQPTVEEQQEQAALIRRRNFGFERVERLIGNIGYIEFSSFYYEEGASEIALSNVMQLVSNTSGLIIDVSGGGNPEMVSLFVSYLVSGKVHLDSFVYRDERTTEEYWTRDQIIGPHYGEERPIYLVVDEGTFSAAEGFSYVLRNLNRVTIVGETTVGGAHPIDLVRLHDHFMMSVPVARSVNPVTGTNWQYVGIRPDHEVPPEEAFQQAQILMLEELIAGSEDSVARREQEFALRQLQQ